MGYIYKNKEALNSVQNYLNDVSKVLSNKNIDASTAKNITWSSDTMEKASIGLAAVGGTGAAVAAGAGAAGIGAAGAGSLVVGAAGSVAAGTILVPVLVAALPIVALTGVIVGGLVMHFKDEEGKERLRNELQLYQDALKKQNAVVKEIAEIKIILDKERDAYGELYKRYLLLKKINDELMECIRKMESDLKLAKGKFDER